ncbi:MAG TPA: DUF5666 domain-containing protein [Candidatus Angelobacter sp.]
MKKILTIPTLILLFAILAFAHGNEEHVIGRVASISKTSITVHTLKNETKEVAITDKTTFQGQSGPAKAEDVKVGDRVVIHAGKDGEKLVAHTVRFSPEKTTASSH